MSIVFEEAFFLCFSVFQRDRPRGSGERKESAEEKERRVGRGRDISRNWLIQLLETSKSEIWREISVVGWSTDKHRLMSGALIP